MIREGVHSCDATLVADQWLITSSSCFDGYSLFLLIELTILIFIIMFDSLGKIERTGWHDLLLCASHQMVKEKY